MNPILVIGAGGHCRSVISVILAEEKWEPIGVIDIGTPKNFHLAKYIIGKQKFLVKTS